MSLRDTTQKMQREEIRSAADATTSTQIGTQQPRTRISHWLYFPKLRVDFEFRKIVLGSRDQTHRTSSRPHGLARFAPFTSIPSVETLPRTSARPTGESYEFA
jgi:hypothetical protein